MEFKAILMTCTLALIAIRGIQKITHNDMIKACAAISAVIALFVVIVMTLVFRANSETLWALLFGAWAINVILDAGDDD
uniref:Uncharacterized protein n=1 Tax=virus sp. ctqEG8 TaxID=2827998 RepID=A0A8S5RFJ4_9VIRU|nr:MAG TPA: hypothetical protein [virus sp. ctqEG8]